MDRIDKNFRPTISWALSKNGAGQTECIYGVDDKRYVIPATGSTWVRDPKISAPQSPETIYHVLIVTNTLNLKPYDEPQVVYEGNTGSDSVRSMPLTEWPRNLIPEGSK